MKLPLLQIVLLVFGLIAAPLRAQDEAYRPWLDQVLLSKASEISVAKLKEVSVLSSRDRLLTFQVSKRLKGDSRDKVLAVGAGQEILAFQELPKILFLGARGSGFIQDIIDFVDLPESGGRERVDFLEQYITQLKPDRAQSLERRMKEFSWEHLPTRNTWVSRIVLRELRLLARAKPMLFDGQDLITLRDFDSSFLAPGDAPILREIVQLVEEGNALGWSRGNLVFPDEDTRRSFLADLARFERSDDKAERLSFLKDAVEVFGRRFAPFLARTVHDAMPEVRAFAIEMLGEMESASGLASLEELALRSKDLETRRNAIVAIGKIAPLRSVPVLLRCLETDALQRESLAALVSINSADAALVVKDFEERLKKMPGSDPELRHYLARIRSDDYQKSLEAARQARRKRFQK